MSTKKIFFQGVIPRYITFLHFSCAILYAIFFFLQFFIVFCVLSLLYRMSFFLPNLHKSLIAI